MRRFEHPSGKFWSIEELGRTLTVRWGAIGTAGQRRDINFAQGDDPRGKLRELVAKQLALGYIEVMNTAEIVATIREDVRWYRLFEGQDGRSVALAVDGRRCYEWRDGSRDYTEHRGADFAEAKASAAAIIAVAITQGMVLGDKSEPRVEHDPTLKLRIVANPELEAQCRAAPDDPAPWAVYADWLMTQSDPRGEIAALRAQGKEPEANALFLASAAHLFGEADESEDSAFHEAITITSWRHGFARGATIKIDADSAVELDEATRRFLALPFAGFIDELQFGLAGMESNNNWGPTIRAVTEAPHAEWMRVLRFDDFTYEDQEISWTGFGNFSEAWSKLPALEELRIRSGEGGILGTIELPHLKKFVRVSGGLRESEILSITSAKWPELEHLEIWFGRGQYNAEGHAAHLTPIFGAKDLSALRHLGICNCEFSSSAIEGLLASKLLPQLRSLDLSRGIIAARELEVLLANADKLGHLTSIDVSENYLDAPQVRRLQQALPNVASTSQRALDRDEEDDEDNRYAALGE